MEIKKLKIKNQNCGLAATRQRHSQSFDLAQDKFCILQFDFWIFLLWTPISI